VTYTTFQARDLGEDTAELFQAACREAYERFRPEALLVGASCTAELIQDDPGGLAEALDLPVPVIPLELPSYQRKECFGADETFFQLVRRLAGPVPRTDAVSCNILGPTALGFRHRDDVDEISRLVTGLGIDINVVAPWQATPADLARLGAADFNIVLYPEVAETAALWLKRQCGQPMIDVTPIGVSATREFICAVAEAANVSPDPVLDTHASRLPWYSRSVDSTYLTGKRVFIFGDATHAVAAARVASEEMGFEVVGLGTYSREFARNVRAAARQYGIDALITDDYLAVEQAVKELQPELILGTQMERHIAKRLGIACAMISAPMHVQDFPAARSPQMGFEGANVLFDAWVHPLVMGLEDHLLRMFSEDFEFSNDARPSHLGAGTRVADATSDEDGGALWSDDAEKALSRIPFFVRGKARRNTERYARERGLTSISLETLYDAKAHFSR
jgi:light-independent protochlorophyllide reductase subunit B